MANMLQALLAFANKKRKASNIHQVNFEITFPQAYYRKYQLEGKGELCLCFIEKDGVEIGIICFYIQRKTQQSE